MTVERFTFEVDREKMFDMVAAVGDGGSTIGLRIAGVLLAGQPDWRDVVGLTYYGVTFISEPSEGSGS